MNYKGCRDNEALSAVIVSARVWYGGQSPTLECLHVTEHNCL